MLSLMTHGRAKAEVVIDHQRRVIAELLFSVNACLLGHGSEGRRAQLVVSSAKDCISFVNFVRGVRPNYSRRWVLGAVHAVGVFFDEARRPRSR